MGVINVLTPQVANLIAAGEVVDRPASVIKELMENSIDAGARQINVEIKHGGITFMRVSDDGCGMSKEDVPVCIKRHATSKIKDESDLDGIATLGFRGEALAAIGSVSTLKIFTKPHGQSMGTQLLSVGGEIHEIIESGCRDGTTIIVEELFANVPARRKFLKKDTSEALAVAAVVEKIALSRPDLSIRFISDDQLRFSTAGDGNLKNCIYAVLGRDFAQKMTDIHGMTGGIEVLGYVGTPENIRANRNYQNFFINGRYIKSRTAMAALEQAFTSYIPSDKFPCCVLYITIHPALVDVNVHPTKLEVKFSNEQAVFDAVYSAVRSALERNLARPILGLKTHDEAKREAKLTNAFVPIRENGMNDINKGEQISLEKVEKRSQAVSDMHLYSKHADDIPPHMRFNKEEKPVSAPLPFSMDNVSNGDIYSSSGKSAFSPSQNEFVKEIDILSSSKKHEPAPEFKKEPEKTEPRNEEKSKSDYSFSNIKRASAIESSEQTLPEYNILGEAFNSYIMVETGGKLLLIDKHAAHERILFEDMKKNISKGAEGQILLIPLSIRLSPEETDAAISYKSDISALGFSYEIKNDGRTAEITSVPVQLEPDTAEAMFVSICGKLASGTGNVETASNTFFEEALYQASCKAAIKAGRIYDKEHIEWICRRVLANDAIRFCPHGRPVAFELTKNEIEHFFKRK